MQRFLAANSSSAAPVSADVPLLSNQDVIMNISLIKQYHENMAKEDSTRFVMEGLQRLGIAHVAYKRNPALTSEERFRVMLLRAAMVKDALIAIDRPFQMIAHTESTGFLFESLGRIEDLFAHCYIFEYRWMKEKYGDLCL